MKGNKRFLTTNNISDFVPHCEMLATQLNRFENVFQELTRVRQTELDPKPLCHYVNLKKKCECYDKVIFFEKNFVSFRFDLSRIVNFTIFPIVLLHNKSVIFARVILSFYFLLLFQQYKGHCFKVTKTNYIRVINQMTQLF